jgi:hypothetical protein
MRVFLVGVLSVTLIGCSCPTAPQAMLEGCTSKPCFYRTAASPTIEPKPTPVKPNRTAKKAESKNATKTAKTASVAAKAAKPNPPQASNGSGQTSNGSDKEKLSSPITKNPDSSAPPPQPVENAKSTVGTNVIVAIPRQGPEASDPVLEKAKVTVASKMEDPASVEFEDMNRAVRHDTFGQSIDTICGHVRGKNTSGAETGKRAFLYLVREDIAFVDYGYSNSRAANAYRSVCTTGGSKSGIVP